MDKRELNKKLKPFFDACKKEGYDFSKVYLIENLEGVPRAGYHLYFKADWINDRTICDNFNRPSDRYFRQNHKRY